MFELAEALAQERRRDLLEAAHRERLARRAAGGRRRSGKVQSRRPDSTILNSISKTIRQLTQGGPSWN